MGCNCSNGNEYISEMLNERQEIKQEEEKENEKTFIEDEGDIIINFEEEKVKLMDKLSLNGFFLNKDIKLIIENINPKVNSFKIPEEIKEKMKNINIIKLPLIKLNDGSIYEGCWNLNGQKEGFGISVLNNKYIYKGLWKNDNFNIYGFLFNNKENYYYIGEFIDGKAKGKGELLINNKNIMEILLMEIKMDLAYQSLKMELNMKENLKMINIMEKEKLFIQTNLNTKDIFIII